MNHIVIMLEKEAMILSAAEKWQQVDLKDVPMIVEPIFIVMKVKECIPVQQKAPSYAWTEERIFVEITAVVGKPIELIKD